jgi:Flp pilus assembly protein TadG
MAFVFGVMEICIAFYVHESISELAREGTRYAIVHGSSCETSSGSSCTATAANVQIYIAGLGLVGSGGGAMTVTASFPDGNENPGSRAQVTIQYTLPFKIAFMKTSPVTMSSTSMMYILQ